MSVLFVEHLTVIDSAFLDAQRGLVGESWIVDLELEGTLDDQGMVLDFGEVKKRLKKAIEDLADHKLIVPGKSPALQLVLSADDAVALTFEAGTGAIQHESPAEAVCVLEAEQVSAASLCAHVTARLRRALPANVTDARVVLRNEDIAGAYYHYTHGLRKHAGHCQRIAHGHRSRLEIRINGARDKRFEQRWASRWRDIYLGTSADVVVHRQARLRFQYAASAGRYMLELPADRCDLLSSDSTVEQIAARIAAEVAAERPGAAIEVRAYEGVMKGAVARS